MIKNNGFINYETDQFMENNGREIRDTLQGYIPMIQGMGNPKVEETIEGIGLKLIDNKIAIIQSVVKKNVGFGTHYNELLEKQMKISKSQIIIAINKQLKY